MSGIFDAHADLYDAAFSWDTNADADWLLERLVSGHSAPVSPTLLEPGCGSGRMFPALARRGARLVGIDRSPTMLQRARDRMHASDLPEPTLIEGDMADFDLGRPVDGAYCPIGGLGYLTSETRAASHLTCVARHLVGGARYLIQLDLMDLSTHRLTEPDRHSRWEVDAPFGRLRCSAFGTAWDPGRRVETQACRFEILSGSRAGEVHEGTDDVLLWDWAAWHRLIDGSPFRQTAAFDAHRAGTYEPLAVGPGLVGRRLVWHELERL